MHLLDVSYIPSLYINHCEHKNKSDKNSGYVT